MYLFVFGPLSLRCCSGVSLAAGNGGYPPAAVHGLSLWLLLLLRSTSSRVHWLQQLWFLGSRVQAQWLWCTGLIAPQHVGFSWIRDQTHVSGIRSKVLYH